MAGAREVELLSAELGNSLVQNMATEATMKELLKSINQFNEQLGAASGGTQSLIKSVTDSINPIKKAESAIKSVAAPLTGFIGNIAKNKHSFSDFSEHVNNTLIKHIPFVGGYVGGFVGLVTSGIRIIEGWDKAQRRLAPLGATFGNNLIEFRRAAAMSRMSVDEYSAMLIRNIDIVNTLGATTDVGRRRFSEFMDGILRPGTNLRHSLTRMGYTTRDINEVALVYLGMAARSFDRVGKISDDTAEGLEGYAKRSMILQKLLGDKNRQAEAGAQAILRDSITQIRLNQISDGTVRGRIVIAMEQASRLYGPGLTDMIRGYFGFGQTLSEAGVNLKNLFPSSQTLVEGVMAAAQSGGSAEAFQNALDELLVDGILKAAQSIGGMDNLLDAMSAGTHELSGMYSTIQPILQNIEQFGEGTELSRRTILEGLRKARADNAFEESLTQILRTFSVTAEEFSNGMIRGILEGMSTFDLALTGADLANKFELFGRWIFDNLDKAYDNIVDFFQHAGSPEGRNYLMSMIRIWASNMKDRLFLAMEYGISNMTGGRAILALTPGLQYRTREEYESGMRLIRVRENIQNQQSALLETMPHADLQGAQSLGSVAPAGTEVRLDFLGSYAGRNDAIDMDGNQPQYLRKNANGQWTGWSNGTFFTVTDPTLLRMVENRAMLNQSYDPSGRLGPVFYPGVDPQNVPLANRKYNDLFTNILMFLTNAGIPINNVSAYDAGSTRPFARVGASMQINNGENLYSQLQNDPQTLSDFLYYLNYNRVIDTNNPNHLSDLMQGIFSVGVSSNNANAPHSNPDQFRFGTLGETGKLFNDFGPSTRAVVSGDKAVVTKPQLENLVAVNNQIPVRNLVIGLNTHINRLIEITQNEIRVERSMINAA